MNQLRRYSSIRQRLDHTFLIDRLRQARSYRRIAGYFRSSILELTGEALEQIPDVTIICNSDIDPTDWAVAARREQILKAHWYETSPELEAALRQEHYQRLDQLLSAGTIKIHVVPRHYLFLHGKAGIIEQHDGTKTCFLGSANETREAFAEHYELIWEDPSHEGVQWVEEEFYALLRHSLPLPQIILDDIHRMAKRQVVSINAVAPKEMPGTALSESPLYRNGFKFEPWQRAFVTRFLFHREAYGKARLLLADDVGLGKTLSLAAAAIVANLLDPGPVLILCPPTITQQWQVELLDKFGIPSSIWDSKQSGWRDHLGHVTPGRGKGGVSKCPTQIAIVSTGLITSHGEESDILLQQHYCIVVLDEAHKARRKDTESRHPEWTILFDFIKQIGPQTRHLLLGTATPIQLDPVELWDLMRLLNAGSDFVLGNEDLSIWSRYEASLPIVKGEVRPSSNHEAWDWLRNPLPPKGEHHKCDLIRKHLKVTDRSWVSSDGLSSSAFLEQWVSGIRRDPTFFQDHNPIVRHTIARRRTFLEEHGLLDRVGVTIHPTPGTRYPNIPFVKHGLQTNLPFERAYQAVEEFGTLLRTRQANSFYEHILHHRLCSSFEAGRLTAIRLLSKDTTALLEENEEIHDTAIEFTPEETDCLKIIRDELSREDARDPKLHAVQTFLVDHHVDGRTWLDHGAIVFSQYYDTVHWIAGTLAHLLPHIQIAIYAGGHRSSLFYQHQEVSITRESIKEGIKNHTIHLVIATDAAREGLNLQNLGTLINVDLPWNPASLEQRIGRIRRYGQARRSVDVLNLVYQKTRDERVYEVLSERVQGTYELFDGLPDGIRFEWTDNVKRLRDEIDRNLHMRAAARNAFTIRALEDINPDIERWELCEQVLSRKDLLNHLVKPWET